MSLRFYNENFADPSIVSSFSATSEQAAFPATNMQNKQRRGKVWRSNGFWKVVAGSNTIVFRESVGVDLTATVAAAEYTSSLSFFSAVAAGLNAAPSSGSVYVVSADVTTGKIVIASDGAGGGGIFQIRWTDGASAAMAGILGYSTATNDESALTYTADSLRLHTEEEVLFDFGMADNPTSFIAIGRRGEAIQITPSATLKIEASETDNFTTPSFSTVLSYDDLILFNETDAGIGDQEYRFWRLLVVDVDNPNGYVELGSVYLGKYFEATRGKANFPLNNKLVDRSKTVFSQGGQTFSDIQEQTQQFNFTFNALTKAEADTFIKEVFEPVGTSIPFFIQMDKNAAFSVDNLEHIRYVKFANEPTVVLSRPGFFSVALSLLEQL